MVAVHLDSPILLVDPSYSYSSSDSYHYSYTYFYSYSYSSAYLYLSHIRDPYNDPYCCLIFFIFLYRYRSSHISTLLSSFSLHLPWLPSFLPSFLVLQLRPSRRQTSTTPDCLPLQKGCTLLSRYESSLN